MFKGLFGKKHRALVSQKLASTSTLSAPETPAPTPAETIKVYDKFGRELEMKREDWRKSVLPGAIQGNWDDADRLYGVVVNSFNDGFFSDVLNAAKRLTELEPSAPRATCAYGIALMKTGGADEAEHLFISYVEQYGEDGSVLTNLAKVYAEGGDDERARRTLWRALEVDPNQDNGLGWFWALTREREGDAAGVEALHKVAALWNSWRPQLWLARIALESGRVDEAVALYRLSLDRMGSPAPADGLMQISGDLGNAGHLSELLQLCLPKFVAEAHGLMVGNNLIKASIETNQLDQAGQVLAQLYKLQRPDWEQTLRHWDTELAGARIKDQTALPARLEMTLLTIDGPVWAGQSSPALELFPDHPQGTLCCFLGASAEGVSVTREPTRQLSDGPGRASRGIPLYFAEQLHFRLSACARTLIPWIADGSGFVLSGQPWGDEAAVGYARASDPGCAWLFTTHLRCEETPWAVDVRLLRLSDGVCVEAASSHLDPQNPEEVVVIGTRLASWLARRAGLTVLQPPPIYTSPKPDDVASYLLRLEQLLALRCAAMDGAKNFIHGAREIIQGDIELCLRAPESVNARLILAQSISCLQKVEPSVLPEIADRVRLLQKEKWLESEAQAVINAAIERSLEVAAQ